MQNVDQVLRLLSSRESETITRGSCVALNSNNMQGYRITKYNPSYFAASGAYLKDEWTSISDVGKVFADGTLTLAEYQKVEDVYLTTVRIFADAAGINSLHVVGLEIHDAMPQGRLEEGQNVSVPQAVEICREMLRERPVWCRLENEEGFYVHIGYDYYMYIGVSANTHIQQAVESVKKLGLFVEKHWPSPYHIS